MWTVILTALRGLWSKVGVYGLTALGIGVTVLVVAAKIFQAGKAEEQLGNAKVQIENIRRDHRIEADIDALSASAARERLRKQWGKR
jgi:hypothetical protein